MEKMESNQGLKDLAWVQTRLGIRSASTIYGLIRRKEIPFIKIGKSLRFDEAQISEWLAAKRVADVSNGI